jgi:hypothetical protein
MGATTSKVNSQDMVPTPLPVFVDGEVITFSRFHWPTASSRGRDGRQKKTTPALSVETPNTASSKPWLPQELNAAMPCMGACERALHGCLRACPARMQGMQR